MSLAIVIVSTAVAAAILIVGQATPAGATAAQPVGASRTVDVYFTSAEEILPLGRVVGSDAPALEASMRELLAGPTAAESRKGYGTDIPPGTTLLSATVDAARRRAIVDFSAGFEPTGTSDAAYMDRGRVSQVVLTAQNAVDVNSVEIRVNGATHMVTSANQIQRPTSATASASPAPTKSVAKKAAIREAQFRLVELKYLPADAVNGKHDYRTLQAVMAFQAWQGLRRDGDIGPKTVAALVKATPPKPRPDKSKGRSIQVYRSKGVLLLVENGTLVRAIHCSTGRPGFTTPSGRYAIYLRETRHWSTQYNVWLPLSQFFYAGYALHEYPDVPAVPASHGCCRMPAPDALVVWKFASVGTPVTVY